MRDAPTRVTSYALAPARRRESGGDASRVEYRLSPQSISARLRFVLDSPNITSIDVIIDRRARRLRDTPHARPRSTQPDGVRFDHDKETARARDIVRIPNRQACAARGVPPAPLLPMNSILAPDNAPPASATRTSPLMSALARAVVTAPLPGSDRAAEASTRVSTMRAQSASAIRIRSCRRSRSSRHGLPESPACRRKSPARPRSRRAPRPLADHTRMRFSPPRLGVRTARPPPAGRSKPARGASAIRLRVQRRSSRLTMTLINVIVIARAPQTAIVAHRGIGPRAIGRLTARRRAARPSTLETRPSYETATHRNR